MYLLLAALISSYAGTLAGVTMPDTATSGAGTPLVLNGMGLREKFFFDIYVGGLYLPTKTADAKAIIEQDVPKRVVMHFTYSKVTRDQLLDSFDEAFAKMSGSAALKSQIDQLKGAIEGDVVAGDVIILDYVPGAGTTLTFKGKKKVTIAGAEFMRLLWAVYVGPNPPTEAFKRGLLGQ